MRKAHVAANKGIKEALKKEAAPEVKEAAVPMPKGAKQAAAAKSAQPVSRAHAAESHTRALGRASDGHPLN